MKWVDVSFQPAEQSSAISLAGFFPWFFIVLRMIEYDFASGVLGIE